jgi:hypothetical protein
VIEKAALPVVVKGQQHKVHECLDQTNIRHLPQKSYREKVAESLYASSDVDSIS